MDKNMETVQVPFDPWVPPDWFQTLAHEHAEHLLHIVNLIQGRRIQGEARNRLRQHIVFESNRYLTLLERSIRNLTETDTDTSYHLQRLHQHITLTRDLILSNEISMDTLQEILHHFIEEQAMYLGEEAREKVLEAIKQVEMMSQWTVGPLMEE